MEPRSVPGYSKGAPYSNFESNEAIFLELLRHYMERDMAEWSGPEAGSTTLLRYQRTRF